MLWREACPYGSFLSTHGRYVHFGLGEADHVDELRIHWPGSRTEQVLSRLPADRRIRVVEGGTWTEVEAPAGVPGG